MRNYLYLTYPYQYVLVLIESQHKAANQKFVDALKSWRNWLMNTFLIKVLMIFYQQLLSTIQWNRNIAKYYQMWNNVKFTYTEFVCKWSICFKNEWLSQISLLLQWLILVNYAWANCRLKISYIVGILASLHLYLLEQTQNSNPITEEEWLS